MNESFFVGNFMLFVASTHILGIHDLPVILATENTEFYVQTQKKALHREASFRSLLWTVRWILAYR